MKISICIFLSLLLLKNFSAAQDSLRGKIDTVKIKDDHPPLVAGLASAILPGAGQVYNKKYWKVPIVYAGLVTTGYFIYTNASVYYAVHNNLDSRVAGDSVAQPQFLTINNIFSKTTINLNDFTFDDLVQIEDDYRKYFTLSLIAGGVVYMLNILDAVVDAHLYHFDVSDDLSLDVRPQLFSSFNGRTSPGFSLSLLIK